VVTTRGGVAGSGSSQLSVAELGPSADAYSALASFRMGISGSASFQEREEVHPRLLPVCRRYTRNAEIDQILTPGVRSLSDSACFDC
jgi:hypothetical protein